MLDSELPVILTALVRVQAFIVLIALLTVTGDLVEFVTVKVIEVVVGVEAP